MQGDSQLSYSQGEPSCSGRPRAALSQEEPGIELATLRLYQACSTIHANFLYNSPIMIENVSYNLILDKFCIHRYNAAQQALL